jgi:insulysin
LTLGGYNEKLGIFASYVTKNIRKVLPSNEKEFERYKDQNARGLASFDVQQPYFHCSSYALLSQQPGRFLYSNKELRRATTQATLRDLESYVDSLWNSGKALALIQGNLDEKEAQDLVATIDKALKFKPISSDDYPQQLEPLPLPPIAANAAPTRLVISEPNPSNSNSACYVTIQNLSQKPKDHVLMELISTIFSEPFYESLRTKQQLGYIVSSGIRALGKTKYIGFVAQSSVAPTEKLTTEILKYLDAARVNLLEKLSDADFAVYIRSLIDRKTEPDKYLTDEVTRNWAEIASGRLQFDRAQQEAAALLDVTKEDLLNFWDELYVKDGRRLLITEMVPRIGVASSAAPPLSTGYTSDKAASLTTGLVLGIDDIEEFRKGREKFIS